MPGIAASEPPIRTPSPVPSSPLSWPSTIALSFIDTRCTPSLPLSRSSLSLSPSASTFLLDWLQCQWTTTDSLLGSLESIRCSPRARVRAYVRVHVCASVIRNPGERTYLSTGNKLTSCRKLANVPWEDSSGERVAECGRPFPAGGRNKKRSFARRPEMRIRLGKTAKTFYSRFIIHGAGFCDKCAVTGKNNERQG